MSAIPDWVVRQHLRKAKFEQQLHTRARALAMLHSVADSPATAPGYREVGWEMSCAPDPVYPWDPEVLKGIWSFDPGAIPIWLKWVFVGPSNEGSKILIFGRHALGRKVENPEPGTGIEKIEMPVMPCQGISFSRPNKIEKIIQGPMSAELPGDYRPFDWRLCNFLRERYNEKSAKELKQDFRGSMERLVISRDKLAAEREYANRDLDKYIEKKIEQAGELEARNHFEKLRVNLGWR